MVTSDVDDEHLPGVQLHAHARAGESQATLPSVLQPRPASTARSVSQMISASRRTVWCLT